MEIRAVEIAGAGLDDAQMLLELLNQIPPAQEIAMVTANGANDTRKCNDAIAARDSCRHIAAQERPVLESPEAQMPS